MHGRCTARFACDKCESGHPLGNSAAGYAELSADPHCWTRRLDALRRRGETDQRVSPTPASGLAGRVGTSTEGSIGAGLGARRRCGLFPPPGGGHIAGADSATRRQGRRGPGRGRGRGWGARRHRAWRGPSRARRSEKLRRWRSRRPEAIGLFLQVRGQRSVGALVLSAAGASTDCGECPGFRRGPLRLRAWRGRIGSAIRRGIAVLAPGVREVDPASPYRGRSTGRAAGGGSVSRQGRGEVGGWVRAGGRDGERGDAGCKGPDGVSALHWGPGRWKPMADAGSALGCARRRKPCTSSSGRPGPRGRRGWRRTKA